MITYFSDITFKHPHFFWLMILVPLMIVYFIRIKRKTRPRILISTVESFHRHKPTIRQRLVSLPIILRCIAVALMIVALARPQSNSKASNITSEGISIVVSLDISESMLAEDLRPNRIEAAKKVAIDFITARPNDLIGLVTFSGESFTQCPLTNDHSVITGLMKDIHTGMLAPGTAIGEGLATAVARVKDSKTKNKVVILITDGVNNAGSVHPLTAGEIARTFGIRVYTIGVGTKGTAPWPRRTPLGIQYQNVDVEIDEDLLTEIAQSTDAKYFRAMDNKNLRTIFSEIDQLEKTKIEVTEFKRYTEEYLPWLLLSFMLFALELLLRYTWLRTLP
jgi:Ca-activated chloride channel homolog